MSWPAPWAVGRSQAECEVCGLRVVALTLDGRGRCAHCSAHDREPEPELAPALFDPDGEASSVHGG